MVYYVIIGAKTTLISMLTYFLLKELRLIENS